MKKDFLKEKKPTDIVLGIVLLVLATVFLLTAGTRIFGRNARIVSADINIIMSEHPAFLEAMEVFQSELQEMQDTLENLDGEERIARQQIMQQQIQALAVKLQEEAMEKVYEDVKRIARQKGYDYIIDSSVLLVGGKDVTDEIMRELMGVIPGILPDSELELLPMIPVK